MLITLSNQYKDVVAPLLLATFGQVVGRLDFSSKGVGADSQACAVIGQPTPDLASIIQKEALYCAIGRCATRLKALIPFDDWLEEHLVVESQDPNPKCVNARFAAFIIHF